jgi:cobalt-zinc-cadmium efflux system outer membrane protein
MAFEHNPTLAQAAARVQAAEGRWVQAGLYPNPAIAYLGDEMGNEGRAGFQGAMVTQEVVTAGKLRYARAAVSHEIQEARHDQESQQRRVVNDVRIGFFEVLAAQRAIELAQQLVRIAEESLKATERLLEAQEVSRIEVLEARIETDSARLKFRNSENRHRAAWRRLAAVLGQPQLEPAPLAGDLEEQLPELTWEGALDRLLTGSPELAKAQAGVEKARCALARECAQRIPNLNVQAGVQHDNATGYNVANVQFGLPLPLFNRNQGNIARAQADLVAAENEVQRVELELHERLAVAFQHYGDARQQVDAYQGKILPNARASLDLVRSGYRQGEVGYLTLLTAQRTFFSVNAAHLESLRQLRTSKAAMDGLLLRGGLRAASNPSDSQE